MSAPPEVDAFVDLLPSCFPLVKGLKGWKGRCIEACRLATALLPKIGVPCKALACDVNAVNAKAFELMTAGVPVSQWPKSTDAWWVAIRCDYPSSGANFQEPDRRRGFGGHLVVVGEDWFLDLTAQQLHRPQYGILVRHPLTGPYDPAERGVEHLLDRGGRVHWYWRPEVKRWRTTPAWRQDVSRDLIKAMATAVAKRMEGAPDGERQGS